MRWGTRSRPSAGWVLLTWVPRDGRLINQSVSDTSSGVAGGIPILALDMYEEHAYHLDFGANPAAYVATFMRNIDWSAVQGRYEDAIDGQAAPAVGAEEFGDLPSITIDEVKAMFDRASRCRSSTRARSTTPPARRTLWKARCGVIPSASMNGSASYRRTTPVVTFCVYGFHIGCETGRQRCAMPASTRVTWPVDTTRGRRERAGETI